MQSDKAFLIALADLWDGSDDKAFYIDTDRLRDIAEKLDTLEKGYTVVNPADSAGGLHGVLKK